MFRTLLTGFFNELKFKVEKMKWEHYIKKLFINLWPMYEPTNRKSTLLNQWFFQLKAVLSLGDTGQCLQTFLVVTLGRGATGTYWADARDAVKHSTVHRTVTYKIVIWPKIVVPRLRNLVINDQGYLIDNSLIFFFLGVKMVLWFFKSPCVL